MKNTNINIRKATINDTKLIAYVVGTAIGDESMQEYCGNDWLNVLIEIATLETSQYSYRNALIAEVNGTPAGAIIAYDGARLNELRTETLKIVHKYVPNFQFSEDETEAGEYYLDSLCVLPQFRKMGVATHLINALKNKIFTEGHTHLGLIVDFDNPNAEQLYLSIGFKRVGQRTFLGHKMWHLQINTQI